MHTTIMDGDCYEPSTLISWVHEEVPFVAVGFNNSGRGAEELVDSLDEGLGSYYDYFVVRKHPFLHNYACISES